ncbi:glycosyl transferase [Streptococcus pneumoniae]|nr:glycosyl transferase [Streptococcus pneumoniae]VMK64176.1 glycosyl transferase [Streptococcus pneumoniae]VTC11535.1 glycosyl transferase [Streptococcus pneumoniae]
MKDLISVIVPVYNVEPFISSCLDSLSKQIYQNFEVLLVNDGSTDNSGAICREYADRDSRFHYFEKENAGVADARNFGIERSKGDYITFVDSDDWVTEEYLSILIETLKEQHSEIVVSTYSTYNESDGLFYIHVFDSDYYVKNYNSKLLMEELPLLERYDMSFLTSINKVLYWYRVGKEGLSNSYSPKMMRDDCDFRLERIAVLALKGYDVSKYLDQMKFYLKYRHDIAIQRELKENVETRRLEMLDYLLNGNKYN